MPHTRIPVDLRSNAKALRRNLTDAERKLWSRLRAHRLGNLHFRRQAPIGPFIADFSCHAASVIIELDGGGHADNEQFNYDRSRDQWFSQAGYLVLRFWNNEVLTNLDSVCETIYERVTARLRTISTSPSQPSPARGEGISEV